MTDTFTLDKRSNIVLYGAASIGAIMHNSMIKKGYTIRAFIDKRAYEIPSLYGKPVYDLSHADTIKETYPDAIIIISVKNVYEHSNIASSLVERGFNKIVYRPYSIITGGADSGLSRINNAYNDVENLTESALTNIPKSFKSVNYDFKDYSIVKHKSHEYVCMVPVELIYSYNIAGDWGNLPMMSFYPHINFFKYVGGDKNANISDYINFCKYSAKSQEVVKVTNAWIKNVVQNRSHSYDQMNLSFDIEPEYFIRNAPNAEWNAELQYFNLTSGKHRITFLLSKNKYYAPLRIKKNHYDEWMSADKYSNLVKRIKENNVTELSSYVAHPYFFRFNTNGGNTPRVFLMHILRDVAQIFCNADGIPEFRNRNIYIAGEFWEFYSIYLSKTGASVYVQEERTQDEQHQAIENLIGSKTKQYDASKGISIDLSVICNVISKIVKIPSQNSYVISMQKFGNAYNDGENNFRVNIISESIIRDAPCYLYRFNQI